MAARDPEETFEVLWKVFNDRYPFFHLWDVNWRARYDLFRPKVTSHTSDDALFEILCQLISPLKDGHIELRATIQGKLRHFNPEQPPRFWREFTKPEIKQLFKTTEKTLVANGFTNPKETSAWMLRYSRSPSFAYLRILELEDIQKRKLTAALDAIARDFDDLKGIIIDIRNNPGGDDDTVLTIVNRFCDRKRIAFHRQAKIGPRDTDLTPLKTWHIEPEGDTQFTGPIALLTCDSVFSGGEVFALAIKQLPHATIIGDRTNGIFSYQLDKKLPNGWRYHLSYQKYYSADMVCYEGSGVPPDIELFNTKADILNGTDSLIIRALELLKSKDTAAEA